MWWLGVWVVGACTASPRAVPLPTVSASSGSSSSHASASAVVSAGPVHLPSASPSATASSPVLIERSDDVDPLCERQRYSLLVDARGAVVRTDCAAQSKRCVAGVCVPWRCVPNALSCREGELVRCDSFGNNLIPEATCRPDSVCQIGANLVASCSSTCDKRVQGLVLAQFECEECNWSNVPFCKREGPIIACGKLLCFGGEIGAGAGPSQCMRDTDGLTVPQSTRVGSCVPATSSSVSVRSIDEEICVSGKPVARRRYERCPSSP